jgi:hypothetical protein
MLGHFSFSQTKTLNYNTSGNIVFGAGVTSVNVSMWGGGGGGSAGGGWALSESTFALYTYYLGAGGGGSNWTGGNVTVVPGTTYNFVVGLGGAAGGFGYSPNILYSLPLAGGNGGASSFLGVISPGGYGGTAPNTATGGARANNPTPNPGSYASAGENPLPGIRGGSGGLSNSGTYGASGYDEWGWSGWGYGRGSWGYTTGVPGLRPGDGGGGGGYTVEPTTGLMLGQTAGGAGGIGRVEFRYSCNYQLTAAPSASNVCESGSSTITLRSSSMPNGNYVVTYSTTNPTTTGNTVNMYFDGTNDSGTFSTISLSGSSVITVTNLASGTTCSNAVSSNNSVTAIVENTSSNDWNRTVDFLGAARSGAASFTLGNKAYLGTGKNGSTYYNDFWVFDATTNAWTQIADFEGDAREGALGLGIGNNGYVGTGTDGTSYFNDFWQYDPLRNDWIPRTALPAAARSFASGFVIGSKGYLGTGWNGTTYYNDFWEYNPSTNAWTAKTAFNGTVRYQAVGFSIGSKGYLGTGANGPLSYVNFSEYDPASNTWTTKASFPGAARRGAVGFNAGNKGYIGTGWNATTDYADFYEYSPTSNTWAAKANFPSTARHNSVGFGLGSKGYIVTGIAGSSYFNDLHEFSSTNTIISTGNISATSFCTGDVITVPFITGCVAFHPTGNTFTAQLSDANGSFANPTEIGSIAGSGSGVISATLPSNTPAGSNYRMRVVGSNPETVGSNNGADFAVRITTINTIVASASEVSICQGESIDLSVSNSSVEVANTSILVTGDFETAMDEWSFLDFSSYEHFGSWYATEYNSWINPDGHNIQSNDASAYYRVSSSGRYSNDVTNSVLQSPVFSTIGYNEVSLSFFHTYRYGNYNDQDSIRVQISTDYGSSWNTVYLNNSSNVGYENLFFEQIVSLNDYANQRALMLRFNYAALGGVGRWYVDNISVKGISRPNTYEWTSNPVGYTSLLQNPTGLMPMETTTYTVINNNNYGCSTNISEIVVQVRDTSSSRTSISICPSELPYSWNGLTFTSGGTQTATLTNLAGCDSLASLQLTILPVSTSITEISICPSDLPFNWNGLLFNEGGAQTAHLFNTFGCDSAATLNLIIKPETSSIRNLNLCDSELPYSWNGLTFTEAGSQSAHFTNSVGCDSTATLNVSLIPSSNVVASTSLDAICPSGFTELSALSSVGNEINVLEESFNATGNGWATYNESSGGQPANADWSLRPYLFSPSWIYGYEFMSNDNSQFYLSSSIAQGYEVTTATILESPEFSTVGLASASLSFFHQFKHQPGINGNMNDSIRVQISTNGNTWNNIYFNNSSSVGLSPEDFVQQIISLNAYLNEPSLKLRFVYNGTPFNLQGWTGFNLWWAIDNVTVSGSISPATYSWSSSPIGFTSSQQNPGSVSPTVTTTYSVVAVNEFCTSSDDVTVAVNATSVPSTTRLTICDSELPYIWNGLTFTGADSQTAHFTVAGACDSAATLVLAVNLGSISTTNITICPSELPYSWNGLTFTDADTQTAYLANSFGCDSAATLVLGVQYANAISSTNMTLCETELPYIWNGQSLSGSGRFSTTLENIYGCDSVANLNLVVNPAPTNVLASSDGTFICNGESIDLSGSVDAISPSLTILSEDFNGNSDYWLSINESTGGIAAAAAWTQQPDGYLFAGAANMHSNDQSAFYISNSYAQGSGGLTNAVLQSPVFSTVGLSAAALKFYHTYYRRNSDESIKVQISTDGSNWQDVYFTNTASPGSYIAFALETLSLADYLDQPYVTIRFVYNAANDYLWAIDNVSITGTPTAMTYEWSSDPIGFSSTDQNPTLVIPTQTSTFTFTAVNGTGCAASSDVVVTLSGTSAQSPQSVDLTICENELPYLWNGLTFNQAESQTVTLSSVLGCDSTVTLNLSVRTPNNSVTNLARCAEALPYVWNGLTFNTAGSQSVTLVDRYGCDSIATLNLSLTSSPISVVTSASNSGICVGMDVDLSSTVNIPNVSIFSEDFNASTNDWLTFNNSSGDGAIALSGWNLRSNGYNGHSSNDNTQFYNTISAVPQTNFTNTVLQSPSFSTMGYPSINLVFYQYYRDKDANDSIRVQASIDNGLTWSNIYLHTTGDIGGQSSFQQTTVSLDAFADQPAVMIRFNYHAVSAAYYWTIDNLSVIGIQAEPEYSWTSTPPGFTASIQAPTGVSPIETTTYTVTVLNAYGCIASDDVTISVSEALTPSSTDLSICQDELPYTWNGLTFTGAGTQSAYLTGASGCDSVATLILTVNPLSSSSTFIEICPSEIPYVWNGLTFNATGSQTATLQNSLGCDSLATLNLTVRTPNSSNTNLSVCPSVLPLTWNGVVFNEAGIQSITLTDINGCDSIATLNLTVNPISSSTTLLDICASELPYVWNGLTFNASGIQTAVLQNSFGCDSLATLNLTVIVLSSTTNLTVCSNEVPYTWNGLTFNTSGIQSAYLTNLAGCDSTATLNLTVNTDPIPTGVLATASEISIELGSTVDLFATSDSPDGTILTEDFNATTNNWIVVDLTTPANTGSPNFTLTPDNTFIISTTIRSNDNTQSYVSTTYGSSNVNVALQSPSFSTEGYSSASLSFHHRYRATFSDEAIQVQVSTDNTNWSSAYSHSAGAGSIGGASFVLQTVPLDAYINEPVVYIRFLYTSLYGGWYWGIDNVSITGTAAGNNYSWASNPIGFNSSEQNPTGVSPTETTVYTVSATNSSGCSATDEVAVVVIAPCTSYSTTQITVCPSELPYSWNGLVFADGGTQTAMLTNIANCDSLATLNLTVAALSSSTNELTICANEIPYTWNGFVFNGSGVHTADLTSVFGCDSTSTLTLTVNPIPTGVLASASDISISNGESIDLTGFSDAISGTILNENFNSPTNNWSSVNNGVNGNVAASNWTLRPNGYSNYGFQSNDNSQFYLSSSGEQGYGPGRLTETFLQSPVFNTLGYSSATLTFYQVYSDYDNNDYCRVEVSTDGGTNWSQVYQNTNSSIGSPSSFQKATVSLNAFIGQANVIVRFNYRAREGYHWAIDNVNVSGSAANNYSWASDPIGFTSTAQNPTGITPTETTTYTLTATNGYGCTASDNVIVQIPCSLLWYADADEDGYGNPTVSTIACSQPANYVANNTDCDDGNSTMNARYDFYADLDGDGFGVEPLVSVCAVDANTPPVGYSLNNTDCDDGLANGEINLQGKGVDIVSGDVTPSVTDNTDFGTVVMIVPTTKTYTIQNTSTNDILVSTIAISGADATLFTVGGITLPATISGGNNASFTLTFTAATTGNKTATVTINNNDCDEGAYTFAIQASLLVDGSAPNPPEVVSNYRCGPGIVSLSASGCSGTYNWFIAGIGGSPIGTSSVFTTPLINETTMYFVACNEDNLLSSRVPVLAIINIAIIHSNETQVSGNYTSSATITSIAIVSSPTNYKSGASILLEPGFKTDGATIFKAEIGPCEN